MTAGSLPSPTAAWDLTHASFGLCSRLTKRDDRGMLLNICCGRAVHQLAFTSKSDYPMSRLLLPKEYSSSAIFQGSVTVKDSVGYLCNVLNLQIITANTRYGRCMALLSILKKYILFQTASFLMGSTFTRSSFFPVSRNNFLHFL